MTELAKGRRITGAERAKLGRDLKKRYEGGASIRELAADTSRSYGFIHRVLTDEGAKLRGRGGATRAKAQQNGAAAKKGTNKSAKARTSK